MINFCFDDVKSSPVLGYPNLAAPGLKSIEFDRTWPRSIPLRLLMYLKKADVNFCVHDVASAPQGSWYPIALGWHDHQLDYFSLIPDTVKNLVRRCHIKILFYYHEGDNPAVIHSIMEKHRVKNQLPEHCYLFISANTRAATIDNFFYFNDHEYFFRYINRDQDATPAAGSFRAFKFTALNRTHKWWRASAMSDLHMSGALDQSLWSYNTTCQIDDDENANPLELDSRMGWRQEVEKFLKHGPYVCDQYNADQHNDHRHVMTDLYSNSYCHLVFETHFDVDKSGGAFLTEKTYKCIKYGQPFIIVGASRSLAVLREQGYRVFDHVMDNKYDLIRDNTARWLFLRNMILNLGRQDLHQLYLDCLEDVQHNQRQFEQRWHGQDLKKLIEYLT